MNSDHLLILQLDDVLMERKQQLKTEQQRELEKLKKDHEKKMQKLKEELEEKETKEKKR